VPANCPCQVAPGRTSDEGDGESGFQMCHFLIQFHRLQPLVFPSWGALHVAACFFLQALVQAHHEICREGDYEAAPQPPPPVPPLKWHKPFDLGVTMSLTGSSPY